MESKIYNRTDDQHLESENESEIRNVFPLNSSIKRQFSEMKARIESVKYKRKKGKKIDKKEENDLKKELSMDEHIITIEELSDRLGTDMEKGLSKAEAEKRLKENGKNILTPPKPKSNLMKFLGFAFSPFSIILWLASGLSFLAYGLDITQRDNLILGVALIVVILLSAFFAYIQGAKSEKVMEGFKKMIPVKCLVIRDGEKVEIDASNLTLGDVVELTPGEKIPADLRIIQTSSLKVDNSSLTGESDPIARSSEMTDENPLETKNLAFYSTSVIMGTGKGVVIKTGDQTVIGRIAGLASSTGNVETPLTREMNHFVAIVCIFATLMAIIFLIAGLFRYSISLLIIFVVGVFVGNIPEGILISVSVCLTLAAKRMAAKNVLVKNLESVETLGSTSTICSDKTGTLTMNQMTVQHLWFNSVIHKSDNNVPGEEPVVDLSNPVSKMLNNIACLCNNAVFEEEGKTRGDASESALIKYCQTNRDITEWRKANPKLVEIPFNSANKFQVSVHKQEDENKHVVMLKGAPERVLARCKYIYIYNDEKKEAEEVELDEEWKKKYQFAYDTLGGKGERVLGFCFSRLNPSRFNDQYEYNSDTENWPMQNLTFCGLISMIDPPKPSVPDAVRKCKDAGIRVVMVTGDHPITAKAIAKQVGIITKDTIEDVAERMGISTSQVDDTNVKAIVVHGSQLFDMNEEEIDEILNKHDEIVFARTSPQQKLLIVEGFQRRGEIVAVTGDGVNDSPALKKADIGVSMGITGSDVSKEAADMILLDDNFASIVKGVEEGRIIFDNLKKTVAYLLPVNIAELSPIFLYIFFAFPLPLSTILMLCVSIGTDMLPAISLSYEKAETDIMKRRPRDPKVDRLVTTRLIAFSYLQIGIIQALAGLFTYFLVLGRFGFQPKSLVNIAPLWEKEDTNIWFRDANGVLKERSYDYRDNALRHAQTAVFVTIVLNQWGTLLICKTRMLSLFQQGMTNYILIIGLIEETVLAVILCYIPPVRFITRTEPITILYWLPALPFTLFIFAYDEIRKLILRHKKWKISHFVEEYSYY